MGGSALLAVEGPVTALVWSPEQALRELRDRAKPIFRPTAAHSRGPTRPELVGLCTVVRQRVARWTKGNPQVDSDDLMGACGIAATALNRALEARGHSATLCMWTWFGSHCWTETGMWAADITATQFNSWRSQREFPEVYVVKRRCYDVVGEGEVFGSETRRGTDPERELWVDWEDQSPAKYAAEISDLAAELADVPVAALQQRRQKERIAVSISSHR